MFDGDSESDDVSVRDAVSDSEVELDRVKPAVAVNS